jgi:broad specificity phosphatase PhoE
VPTVLLIRHAQASFGTPDYDMLSEIGRAQLEALTGRGIRADRVVTGSLRRQRDTAGSWVQAAATGAATVDPRWNEYRDADVLSHHSATPARMEHAPGATGQLGSRQFQVLLDEALTAWVTAGADSDCDETWPMFLARAIGAFTDLADGLRSGQTGIAITSSGVISALAAWLIGFPPEGFVALNRVTVNTGISKVVIGRQGTTLVSFNEHAHLEGPNSRLLTYR